MKQSIYDEFMRCLEKSLKKAEDKWNKLPEAGKTGANKLEYIRIVHKEILENCLKESDINVN